MKFSRAVFKKSVKLNSLVSKGVLVSSVGHPTSGKKITSSIISRFNCYVSAIQ